MEIWIDPCSESLIFCDTLFIFASFVSEEKIFNKSGISNQEPINYLSRPELNISYTDLGIIQPLLGLSRRSSNRNSFLETHMGLMLVFIIRVICKSLYPGVLIKSIGTRHSLIKLPIAQHDVGPRINPSYNLFLIARKT